jgi:6-phosphogluconolactonase
LDNHVIRVFPDLPALSRAAAEEFVAIARDAVAERGRFTVAMAGGRTPAMLYRLLAGEFREAVAWPRVQLFFGDERYVPHGDPQSNCRMVRECLTSHVPIPPGQVHPMPTDEADPETAARAYEATLRQQFGEDRPVIDLVLLGMGADGHTASLFPGTAAPQEQERLVVAVRANVEPPLRLSLTLPVLAAARRVAFLVAGADKNPAWHRIKADPAAAAREYPAAMVAVAAGQVVWYLDQSADAGY